MVQAHQEMNPSLFIYIYVSHSKSFFLQQIPPPLFYTIFHSNFYSSLFLHYSLYNKLFIYILQFFYLSVLIRQLKEESFNPNDSKCT